MTSSYPQAGQVYEFECGTITDVIVLQKFVGALRVLDVVVTTTGTIEIT